MNQLFLDIETIPGQSPAIMEAMRADAETEKACCKAPANYKDPEKIAANIAEQHAAIDAGMDEKWRKTSFDGACGQIVCVSFALDDYEPVMIWLSDWQQPDYEAMVLRELSQRLGEIVRPNMELAIQVVGHNVAAFDLRFLVQRSIVNGIRPHPVLVRAAKAKPWEEDKVYDTMVQWAGVGNRISLDKLCRALGLEGKGDMDGSKVWDAVKEGRINDVACYCSHDVRKVRAVHKRMTFAA